VYLELMPGVRRDSSPPGPHHNARSDPNVVVHVCFIPSLHNSNVSRGTVMIEQGSLERVSFVVAGKGLSPDTPESGFGTRVGPGLADMVMARLRFHHNKNAGLVRHLCIRKEGIPPKINLLQRHAQHLALPSSPQWSPVRRWPHSSHSLCRQTKTRENLQAHPPFKSSPV